MSMPFRRRRLLEAGLGLLAAPLLPTVAGAASRLGPAQPFSFEALTATAQALAAAPYVPPSTRDEALLDRIDYDAYQAIRYDASRAFWAERDDAFPIQLFHLGRFFQAPVHIHLVEQGQARELLYDPSLFHFGPEAAFLNNLPPDLGFAGFRLESRGKGGDWLAFLGASYFRSTGELEQYGLSTRGLAIDTAMPWPEEFPQFKAFWIDPVPEAADTVLIHALLDSPSIAGAYRIEVVRQGPVTFEIEARLFPRKAIARLGVAPLTSMFWFDEGNRHISTDWRPEVHDSDGLAMWTGSGERLWRPLNNPGRVMTNSFLDRSPRGFGLLQRDRDFTHYEDDGVFYDRRPSVWVEPLHDWGEGAVQLVELPTDDEIHDNIVAYWVPAEPVPPGGRRDYRYRLHWRAEEPYLPDLARVVATRIGRGGVPGQPRPEGVKKLAIDFSGAILEGLTAKDGVEPVVSASRGEVRGAFAFPVRGTDRWRAMFDLAVEGDDPVDLRLYLRQGERTLSETWLGQHLPFIFPEVSGM